MFSMVEATIIDFRNIAYSQTVKWRCHVIADSYLSQKHSLDNINLVSRYIMKLQKWKLQSQTQWMSNNVMDTKYSPQVFT